VGSVPVPADAGDPAGGIRPVLVGALGIPPVAGGTHGYG